MRDVDAFMDAFGYEEIKQKEEFEKLQIEVIRDIAIRKEDEASETIVDYIKKLNYIYTTRDDLKSEVWIYDNGIYKPNGASFIKEVVREILQHTYTPQRANKVIAKIEADTMIDIDEFFGTTYIDEICVENGILNLKTREISKFTPDKIFFNKIPVKYNLHSKCTNIDKFFSEILTHPDDKNVLYELVGFCLHKEYFIEKAFMFLGDGRNGKGKTLSLIKTFLGVENTCAVKLSQMNSDSSALCELHNSLVNLAGDMSNTSLKETGMFKELTGRDAVQVKRKFLRDLKFTNYSKMVFACNNLPRVYDLSEGFWSRWILLQFPYKFLPQNEIEEKSLKDKKVCKLQDPNIIKKLTTPNELSGLLNLALDGLIRIKKNKTFSYSVGTAKIKDFWIRKSDSFTAFCFDLLEQDSDGFISKKEIRQSFNKYCKKHKIKGTSDKNIKTVLEDLFGVIESKRSIDYSQERVWDGIKFKEKYEENLKRHDIHGFSKSIGNGSLGIGGKPMDIMSFSKKSSHNPQKPPKMTDKEYKKHGYTQSEINKYRKEGLFA